MSDINFTVVDLSNLRMDSEEDQAYFQPVLVDPAANPLSSPHMTKYITRQSKTGAIKKQTKSKEKKQSKDEKAAKPTKKHRSSIKQHPNTPVTESSQAYHVNVTHVISDSQYNQPIESEEAAMKNDVINPEEMAVNVNSNPIDMESLYLKHNIHVPEDLEHFSHLEVNEININVSENKNSSKQMPELYSPKYNFNESQNSNVSSKENVATSKSNVSPPRKKDSMTSVSFVSHCSDEGGISTWSERSINSNDEHIVQASSTLTSESLEMHEKVNETKEEVKKTKNKSGGPKKTSSEETKKDEKVTEKTEKKHENETNDQVGEKKKTRRPRKTFSRGTIAMSPMVKVPEDRIKKPRKQKSISSQSSNVNELNGLDMYRNESMKISPHNISEKDDKKYANIPGSSNFNPLNLPLDNRSANVTPTNYSSREPSPVASYVINIERELEDSQDANIHIALPPQLKSKVTNINVHVKGKDNYLSNRSTPSTRSECVDLTSDTPKIKKEKVSEGYAETKNESYKDTEKATTSKEKKTTHRNEKQRKPSKKSKSRRPRRRRLPSESSSSSCGHSSCDDCHGRYRGWDDSSSYCSCSECCDDSSYYYSSDSDEYEARRRRRH